MHVALITVYSHKECTLKDVAGGYGTVFRIGESRRARFLEAAKGQVARLPSVTLGYLARAAENAGHTVTVHEVERGARGSSVLPAADVAVVLTSLVDAESERAVLRELRARGVHTVAVGAHASARPEFYADSASAVVTGEPEALGEALFQPDLEGAVSAGSVGDLDALPFPSWKAFPARRYRYAFLSFLGTTLPISGARGCAFGCGYCPWRVTAKFRERSPAGIAAEAAMLQREYGAQALAFRDPLWNLSRERSRELGARLAPLGLRWSAEMRADRLDPELIGELARAGLRSMEIGVESVDRAMLAQEKRSPPELEQIVSVVRAAKKAGVRVIANFMFGLPDDSEDRIRASIAFAHKLDPFAVQFTVATPYPGTTLETRVRHRLTTQQPQGHTGWEPTFTHDSLSADDLRRLREDAYVGFHFRPRYVASFTRQAVRSLIEDVGMLSA